MATNIIAVNPTGSVIGLTDTKATLDTDGSQGANAALIFTAVEPGVRGNEVKVAQVVPTDDNAAHPLSVDVATDGDYRVITISLEVDTDGSTILSTADDIKAAVAADDEASQLVTVADKAANDGSGVAAAFAAAALTGGAVDDVKPYESRYIASVSDANLAALVAGGALVILGTADYQTRRAAANRLKYEKVSRPLL